ncbi:MAG: ABC transporter substrate-binding protein [Halofilum sp. (in: g-proteobacteria)]|nr:ABC transporter substrate-binding protein [Halofilum sp. (in: g-proteobacteria)]
MHGWSWIVRLLGAGLLALASASATAAPDPQEAQQLVRESTSEMLEVLRAEAADGQIDLEAIRARLNELILPHLDFVTMTKLAVGRDWLQANRDQKRALVEQFRTLLLRTYTRSLREYNDQRLEFLPLQPGPQDDRVTVRSEVIQSGGGSRIPVEYSLRHHDGRWQVYDISVDGVSLVTTYRSSFSDIIGREGIGGLIAHLRQKNAEKAGDGAS